VHSRTQGINDDRLGAHKGVYNIPVNAWVARWSAERRLTQEGKSGTEAEPAKPEPGGEMGQIQMLPA